MILNNAPQAEAVLSNVGEIGEFRIRNSAKAFNILSSGLYANKIKAIIRELSCNALDSHIAAGNDQPFEVHLPTTLEPYFSIRDFGTGLNHEQVTNIYTTYFESTKTNSNAFIGALGLGSKSPFSYTDNFTVTAIKDGHKGIYSAFINGEGVPSIALMGEEDTTEPAGVEIKFSVNERYDFSKFASEARTVYQWFKQKPVITGEVIDIPEIEYAKKDIIPGVHERSPNNRSVAVMGNIAYPIDMPNQKENLEGLHKLLDCGLVLEFGIGELDFQASREGLSYIPQTIQSIKNKLSELNVALVDVLAKEADAIDNEWKRSSFLHSRKTNDLWSAATIDYVTKNNTPLFDVKHQWSRSHSMQLKVADVEKFNISLSGFFKHRNERTCKNVKLKTNYIRGTGDKVILENYYDVEICDSTYFVVNDTKIGSLERAKAHFRNNQSKDHYGRTVFLLNKLDKTKEMDLNGFFAHIHNPPQEQRMVVSDLDKRERVSSGGNTMGKNVSLLMLEERGGTAWHTASKDLVWRSAGTLDEYDDTKTYYYVPMKGFKPQFTKVKFISTVPELVSMMKNSKMDVLNVQVYGVRKADLDTIQSKPNWVNVETYIDGMLRSLIGKVEMSEVMLQLDRHSIFEYNYQKLHDAITNAKSPAKLFLNDITGLPALTGHRTMKNLIEYFGIESKTDVEALVVKYKQVLKDFSNRYPLVSKFATSAKEGDVGEYINLVDTVKGV